MRKANRRPVRDLSKNPLARPLANRFREIVSGAKDGKPDWAQLMALGNDEGFFGPESAVWQVHGCVGTIVGGIRALLLQAAHPAPLAGVAQHSRYSSDPLGRLAGTTKWLTITSFASTEVIHKEAMRVNAMHSRVRGEFETKSGAINNYRAQDPRFLLWVHCAFTDSFLKAHQFLGYKIDKGADTYISEWAKSAEPLGLSNAPHTVSELENELNSYRKSELAHVGMTDEVVNFILHPPFSKLGLLFYGVLARAAIYTLDDRDRELLRLKKPSVVWLKISRISLDFLSAILGHESPSQKIARARIARIRAAKPANQRDIFLKDT